MIILLYSADGKFLPSSLSPFHSYLYFNCMCLAWLGLAFVIIEGYRGGEVDGWIGLGNFFWARVYGCVCISVSVCVKTGMGKE